MLFLVKMLVGEHVYVECNMHVYVECNIHVYVEYNIHVYVECSVYQGSAESSGM